MAPVMRYSLLPVLTLLVQLPFGCCRKIEDKDWKTPILESIAEMNLPKFKYNKNAYLEEFIGVMIVPNAGNPSYVIPHLGADAEIRSLGEWLIKLKDLYTYTEDPRLISGKILIVTSNDTAWKDLHIIDIWKTGIWQIEFALENTINRSNHPRWPRGRGR